MLEDKIIKQKIDSLEKLPEGYEPNLESKWNLIETGLNEGNKKKVAIIWYRIAIAAMLLMIGGGTLMLLKTETESHLQQHANIRNKIETITSTEIKVVPVNSKIVLQTPQNNLIKKLPVEFIKSENIVQIDSSKHNEIIQSKTQNEFVAVIEKSKRTRFIEVDFNDKPSFSINPEPSFASQQFKFKIGFTNSISSSENTSENSSFKLSKSITN